MRKLIYTINTSIDACCDHTKFSPDDEMMAYFTQLNRDADTFLYGRKTYELMVPYWPDVANNPAGHSQADIEFARSFDAVDNIIVCSRSLNGPEDAKTRFVGADLQNEILKLKQKPGKNILTGGVDLPAQLAELDLIDEYRFVVHPIIVGEGRRVFDGVNLQENLKLKLVETTVLRSGYLTLRYLKQ